MSVSVEDVQRVAELASLELTEQEQPRMQKDLSAVLGYIAELNELDTAGVPPMAQVGDMLGTEVLKRGEALRADEVRPCLDRAEVMSQAHETDGRFFKV